MMVLTRLLLACATSVPALAQAADDGAVTFSEHIAPIVYTHCAECHRPGEAAPFALLSYEDVRKRARTIRRVTGTGYMPPWHPVGGHGEFEGSRGLSSEELELLERWVRDGAPQGDPERAPEPPAFPSGWRLGEPDLVLEMEEAFEIPATGPDIYRNFCLPVDLPEDVWVSAIEVRPAARTVVHHVLFFHDDTGSARRLQAADPVPGFEGMGFRRSGSLGGWAMGAAPYALPGGLAMPLPRGADIVLQTHFHPSGKAEREVTRVGIYVADEPPPREIVGIQLPPSYAAFAGLDVPAGEQAFTLRDSMELPVDTELVSVGAHAHYVGKEMRAWAVLPDGSQRNLFYIDDWDFNWQGRYVYSTPVLLPSGTVIETELVYDNSAENPRNPFDPPRRITWGLESTDEMGAITFVAVTSDAAETGALRSAVRAKFADARRNRVPIRIDFYARVMRLDRNGDGVLTADEVPESYRGQLSALDQDEDGVLDEDELAVLKTLGRRRNRDD